MSEAAAGLGWSKIAVDAAQMYAYSNGAGQQPSTTTSEDTMGQFKQATIRDWDLEQEAADRRSWRRAEGVGVPWGYPDEGRVWFRWAAPQDRSAGGPQPHESTSDEGVVGVRFSRGLLSEDEVEGRIVMLGARTATFEVSKSGPVTGGGGASRGLDPDEAVWALEDDLTYLVSAAHTVEAAVAIVRAAAWGVLHGRS